MAESTCKPPSPPPQNIPLDAYAVEEGWEERVGGDPFHPRPAVEEEEEEDHVVSFASPDADDDAHTTAEHARIEEVDVQGYDSGRRKRRKPAQPPLVIVVNNTQCQGACLTAAKEGAACLDPQNAHNGQGKAAHSPTLSLFNSKCCTLISSFVIMHA